MIDYRLYLITDEPSRYTGDWLDNVLAAVEGGVTCVQYRDSESRDDERLARARRLQAALRRRGVPLIINNDVALAATLAAEGVHVGRQDMPPADVRKHVGPECEIGFSVTELAHVTPPTDATCGGLVSCLGIGPVFDARHTKADAAEAMGLEGLTRILSTLGPQRPRTVAIGGITQAKAAAILSAGVDGLALVSAFSKASNPFSTARTLRALFK